MNSPDKLTPMMQQWAECKRCAPKALLLFRMGDFYESFYEDASQLAERLNLTLTSRQKIPMAGVPVSALQSCVDRLTRLGLRVAIAEQLEDPKLAKGLVKREVVRIVSPGTSSISDEEGKSNTYLAALHQIGHCYGIACADISTGELFAFECQSAEDLSDELARARPKELIFGEKFGSAQEALVRQLQLETQGFANTLPNWRFDPAHNFGIICSHFGVHNLDGLGLQGASSAICACGALLQYLQEELRQPVQQLKTLKVKAPDHSLLIDRNAQRHLELIAPLRESPKPASLLDFLDETCTAMGARLLRKWLLQPLKDPAKICQRQSLVGALIRQRARLTALRRALAGVRDLERLATKVNLETALPRDLISLRDSLAHLPAIAAEWRECCPEAIGYLAGLEAHKFCADEISRSLLDEPASKIGEGALFKSHFDPGLDELRDSLKAGSIWLVNYQEHLRESLSIKTLKVGYTPAFGYHIEVSRGQISKMPAGFQRRQTLVNCERFISPDLKAHEETMQRASERISRLESALFRNLRGALAPHSAALLVTAELIAKIDCAATFAHIAAKRGLVCPRVDDSQSLRICKGRHPIVEAHLNACAFIPNDSELDFDRRLMLLTGPNMGGKSTYIRQVALLTILAQMGSYVPAESMHLGVVDKIFTRIGASDDLARGQSTFMVEMAETANILRSATDQSLVILDEIGRGTSTFDGLAIARAIVEYLVTEAGKNPRALFATHYLELTQLAANYRQIGNFHVSVQERGDQVQFLHKITPGSAQKSFGIHVANLAGVPPKVVRRARVILWQLEKGRAMPKRSNAQPEQDQLSFLKSPEDSLTAEVKTLNLDATTPLQALSILKRWQEQAQKPSSHPL